MRFHRLVLLAAAPLALAALLGSAAPAGASLTRTPCLNALTFNALDRNALTHNALAATGSALDELNGVAVEAVALPDAAR